MISAMRDEVKTLLTNAGQSHGIGHTDRVMDLSVKFARNMHGEFDMQQVKLTALLHDADDYKIFKNYDGEDLPNARRILDDFGVSNYLKGKVLDAIREIGFSRRLKGVVPSTIEAMIVSDADMCDATGINGILRTVQYGGSNGTPFFDAAIMPRQNIIYEQYMNQPSATSMNVIFERMLRLKGMMMTAPGYQEASERHTTVVKFLRMYFRENGLKEWDSFLSDYLACLGDNA